MIYLKNKFILPNLVKSEIDLLLTNKFIRINDIYTNHEDIFNVILYIETYSDTNDTFLILYEHEVVKDLELLDAINDCIFRLNKNIKLIQATASTILPNTAHPFTHIFIWKYNKTTERDFLQESSNTKIQLFPNYLYSTFTNIKKTNKFILSTQRETHVRNLLISKINPLKIPIFRYLKSNKKNSIEWSNLITEYQHSYFSFVLETNHSNDIVNHFTEKTILAFLTKTIPIIFGQKYLIRDLERLGFWIANSDFGFEDADIYEDDSIYRINRYSNCIDVITSLSDAAATNYYNSNIDKIYRNWEIISTIFNHNKTII